MRRFPFFALFVAGSALLMGVAACRSEVAPAADAVVAADTAADGAIADTAAVDAPAADVAKPTIFGGLPCPTPGKSRAVRLATGQGLTGPDAVGTEGDWLIANDRAAFVIQDVGRQHTYYHYGGIVSDAAAIEGCTQASPDRLSEWGLLLGKMEISDFPLSILRAFKGTSVEVISDGSAGGEARLRVHGTDDFYWLVELELLRRARSAGQLKVLSQPLGVKLAVDYVLEPGSRALRLEVRATNQLPQERELNLGTEVLLGDTTEARHDVGGSLAVGGFKVDLGMPWLGGGNHNGSLALVLDTQQAALAEIAGVNAYFDLGQAGSPLVLKPAGQTGDTGLFRLWLAVGSGDLNTATREVMALKPGDRTWSLVPVQGTVREGNLPLAGVTIEVERKEAAQDGGWHAYDQLVTGPDGQFTGQIADLGQDRPVRLRVVDRTRPEGTVRQLSECAPICDFTLTPGGTVSWSVTDGAGQPMPARLIFDREGKTVATAYATGTGKGETHLPPGTYQVAAMRGYEYAWVEKTLTVTANATTIWAVTLPHLLNTKGWMAFDGHIHAGPSPDSKVPMVDRIRTCAAEGLDVAVHTDHEIIVDWGEARKASGVEKFVADLVGQEVTASLPEHMNMYGVVPDASDPRGGALAWYQLDLAQLTAAMKQRGAQVVTLNHPRMGSGCSYLCRIGWNSQTNVAEKPDMTAIGLPATATAWTWEFDAVELWNGTKDIFRDPKDPTRTGLWEDWMGWWNGGHFIAGVAVTDVHGWDPPGSPRTYYVSPTDDPNAFQSGDLATSVKAARLVLSAGAFARVSVNGTAGPGEVITDSDGSVDLHVAIEAIPQVDVTWFQVFVNCDEVAKIKTTAPGGIVKYDGVLPIKLSQDAHIHVIGWGTGAMPRGFDAYPPERMARVLTNPIRVDADGDGQWTPPGGKACKYTRKAP